MSGGKTADNNNNFQSLAGNFLISETELMDPNFYHSVVLITDHNEDGAFGLVVNRPADIVLRDVVPEFNDTLAGIIPVFVGGPVEQQFLFLLHDGLDGIDLPEPHMHPLNGVVFQPLTETIAGLLPQICETRSKDIRKHIHLFAGYSGWAAGQLEEEIKEGAWITHPASSEIVFHPNPAKGWHDAMSQKGDLYRIIAQTGFKPSIN